MHPVGLLVLVLAATHPHNTGPEVSWGFFDATSFGRARAEHKLILSCCRDGGVYRVPRDGGDHVPRTCGCEPSQWAACCRAGGWRGPT